MKKSKDIGLPTEINIPAGMTDPDDISDYISDETGFCHYGYNLVAVNIIWDTDPDKAKRLPTEINIPPTVDDEVEYSAYLAGVTGVKPKSYTLRATDIDWDTSD